MGLLDDMIGGALGGGGNSPLGSVLGGLGGGAGNGAGGGLGDLLKQFGGGDAMQSAGLMAALMSLVQQMGGFEGVIQKFQQAGLGGVVQSWLGNGPNAGIGPQQVQDIFGTSAVQKAAQQAGMSTQQTTSAIAAMLPELINQFSPQGKLASNHNDLLQQGLSMILGGKR